MCVCIIMRGNCLFLFQHLGRKNWNKTFKMYFTTTHLLSEYIFYTANGSFYRWSIIHNCIRFNNSNNLESSKNIIDDAFPSKKKQPKKKPAKEIATLIRRKSLSKHKNYKLKSIGTYTNTTHMNIYAKALTML